MLGTNIREYRKKQKLTMKELAERTGLSIGYISQVERGETEPSLSSLRKIAGEFDKNDSSLTIRREERMTAHVRKNSVEYEFLTPFSSQNFSPKALMIKATLEPHSRDSEIPIVHHSEETLLVVKGTLKVVVGEETIVLREGDTTIIKEDFPHTCINDDDDYTEVISVITPPIWGTLHFPG